MTTAKSERYQSGMQVRREVLGDAYVDKAIADADMLSEPLQELIAEYCWGSVWARDDLDRRTRSLINIAMLGALNRPHELSLHLAGALRNGCSPEEIREVILQLAIYCGIPAAVDAMRVARDVIMQTDAGATGQ